MLLSGLARLAWSSTFEFIPFWAFIAPCHVITFEKFAFDIIGAIFLMVSLSTFDAGESILTICSSMSQSKAFTALVYVVIEMTKKEVYPMLDELVTYYFTAS